MSTRQRQRRTLGSGPPSDLLYGELAYSDTDGLLHIGRPDGTVRSYGATGEGGPHTHDYAALVHGHPWSQITDTPDTFPPAAHTHTPIPIALTPINGYQPLEGWPNELRIFPESKMVHVRIAVTRATAPSEALAVVSWTPAYAATANSYGASIANMGATHSNPLQFAFVSGNSLAWLSSTNASPPLAYLLASIWCPYA